MGESTFVWTNDWTFAKMRKNIKVDGFDWDAGNQLKSETKHGMTAEVFESFFQQEVWVAPDVKHSKVEERFLAIGPGPKERPMIVAFTFRKQGDRRLIRPVSARFMHAREAKRYEKAFTQNKK